MQNKKLIILIVLSVFAAISLFRGITTPSKYRVKSLSAPAVSRTQPAGAERAAAHLSMERRAKRTRFKSWKRSPFVSGEKPASATLVLSGIIWTNENPKAMIGDMIVRKGDRVNNSTVIDIRPDKVIMNDGTKNFELKLEK